MGSAGRAGLLAHRWRSTTVVVALAATVIVAFTSPEGAAEAFRAHAPASTSSPSDQGTGIFGTSTAASGESTLPANFQDSVVFGGLTNPTAIRFSPDGRIFVAEKSGLIKIFDSLTDTTPTVFADLNVGVHNYWDRGLLGMTLDPNFPTSPYVYVLYTYDAAIGGTAPRWGTPGVLSDPCPTPPGPTTDGCVVSGRLSRLTASGNTATSEQVFINDWCQQFPSHSLGSLVFGQDGQLYASAGDGASFNYADYGQTGNPCGDPPSPAGTNLTSPTGEGGALRAQDLRTSGDPTTLDGAILRLNPTTGAASTGNPLSGSSDANARRIVAEGLRNPFRFTFRPGTNEIWAGDVGWNTWEEIDRITSPTAAVTNFGWPCYEGNGTQSSYSPLNICANLPGTAVTSPYYTYAHSDQVVSGESCPTGSSSITGMAFYQGGSYPSGYTGALFFADHSRNCIWVMFPGTNGLPDPNNRATFVAGAAGPVDLQIGPGGDLFYVDYDGGTIHRVQYSGSPPPPAGLVAAYAFNEGSGSSTSDASGNGNTGQTGSASWTSAGKYGNALSFDGTSAKVTVADSASLRLTSGMTLEAWVNPSNTSAADRDLVYRAGESYFLEATSSGGGRPLGGGIFSGSYGLLDGNAPLQANAWTHLALTYDGTTLRLYVNGTQVASTPKTGTMSSSGVSLYIGGDPGGQYFAGKIDEVRIYSGARTASQLQTDMTTPISGGGPPDTQPPGAPGTLNASAASSSQINLSWGAASDNVGVTGYKVERCQGAGCSNFAQIATPSGTTFSDSGLASGTSYSYRVRATDAAGNLGPYSNTASATTTSGPPPPAGLVAAYGFNEGSGASAGDASGNGNAGQIGSAAWASGGKYGGALSFDGTSAKVTIPDAPSLRLSTGMTLEAWVNPSTVTSLDRDLIYKDDYFLEATSGGGGRPLGGGIFSGSYGLLDGNAPLPANTWTHLALTYDGAFLRMYVNGSLVASTAQTGTLKSSANLLQIGGDSINGQYFAGKIDEVRIYNTALTQAQIQTDRNTPVT